jgi:diguanylate cyclase (GGDEF)-like protein/PAS domain S-box-containing protein
LLAIAQGASDYWLHGQSSLREMASVFRNLLGQAHLAARCRRLNWLEGFIGEFIWRADPDLRLAEVSASVERLAGLTPEEALQCSLEDLLAPADRPTLQKALAEFSRLDPASEAGRALTLELEHLRRGKANFWAEISLHPVRDPQGKLAGFTGSTRDVSDRHAVQEQLNYISLHDALTGLFNRTYFEEELKRLEYSRLYPITFLTVDLEGLRNINYDQGMQAGDERLKQVANILKLTFRSEDMIARVGGDEFIVIMPRTHARAAAKALQRVANLLETYNQDAPEAAIRLTMGVATAEQGSSLMETLKAANVQKFPQKVTA